MVDKECQIFTLCLEDISIVIKRDGIENSLTNIQLCFTPHGNFAFKKKCSSHASYAQLAVYDMSSIRKLGAEQLAFVFTEELVPFSIAYHGCHFQRLWYPPSTVMSNCTSQEYLRM